MKLPNSLRIPIGFAAAAWFIGTADPTAASLGVGAVLMVLGEAIRFVSAGTLRKFEGVTRNGMYAYTRNPLYAGSLLIGAGACVMGRDPWFALVFAAGFAYLYSRVIFREEWYLRGRYGDEYRRYLAETPRIVPHRMNVGYVLRESSAALAIKNKEGKTLWGIAGIFAVMAAKLLIR